MFVNLFRDAAFSHVQFESNNIRWNISLWNISHPGLMKRRGKKKKRGGMARSTARFMLCPEFLSRTSQCNDSISAPKGPCLSRDQSICKCMGIPCDVSVWQTLPGNPPAGWKRPATCATRQLKELLHRQKRNFPCPCSFTLRIAPKT